MAVEHNKRYIRIWVKFEDDGHLLMSESQKSKGLARTLLCLDTKQYKTVSDLISYIIVTLGLVNVCATDIHLSINGYTLLPSLKTCMLNDEVICVRKITAGGELLPIDVLSDMDRSEEAPKKRKASTSGSNHFKGILSKKPRILNKNNKICTTTTTETSPVAPQHVKNDIHAKQIEHLDSPGSDELADGTAIEHLDSPGSDELTDGTAIEHLDSPGSDELTDGTAELGEIGVMLSYKTLGLSSDDVKLLTSTCNLVGPHYGPMSVLYYLRCFLIFRSPWEVEVVGIEELLNRVRLDANNDASNDASKATETSKNDDPAVELAVDAEGSKKSMKVDDTKGAPSLATIQPSSGAIKFAEGIVAFCKLLTLENAKFFEDEIFYDLVRGIIKNILTVDLLACAHQLFVDKYASIMLADSPYNSDEDEDELNPFVYNDDWKYLL